MLNERQQRVLKYIKQAKEVHSGDIVRHFDGEYTKITLLRDIDKLIAEEKIIRIGKSRATAYRPLADNDEYFMIDPDKRILKSEYYNFNVWDEINVLFNETELEEIEAINKQYRKNRSALSPAILKKELERLTIEYSWKSSQIEGNTYTLLDTERLLITAEEANGKKHEEAIMILNHKRALDFVFEDPHYFKEMTVSKIEELHHILVDGLNVNFGLRQTRVGITGTAYRPLDNQYQIREAMEQLIGRINDTVAPVTKAMLAVLMISYIQPFEDGNKRTARLLGNALLLAYDYCPLSYRSVDETEYKKAVILFYEQNNIKYFKQLFVEQFKQAVAKYF